MAPSTIAHVTRRTKRAFLLVLLAVALLRITVAVSAQGPTGFTKEASVTATTYTDTAVVSGNVWQYAVTATDAAGESGPSNIVTATTPSTTGAHSNALTWTASTGATGYNVYRSQVTVPNPPAGLGVVSN